MIVGAFVYPAGIFWFAWCSLTSVNIWAQVIAGVPIGFGIMVIYLQGLAYMVDVYTVNANSAISANAIVRYVARIFPCFFKANRSIQIHRGSRIRHVCSAHVRSSGRSVGHHITRLPRSTFRSGPFLVQDLWRADKEDVEVRS